MGVNAKARTRSGVLGFVVGACVGSAGAVLFTRPTVPRQDETTRYVPILAHEALRYGYPSNTNVHVRSGYVVSYDYRTRNASWVLEYLTKDSLKVLNETDRTKSTFKVDVLTPEKFRVHPNAYLKSGYDKGHLAPARNMANSQRTMDESFLMTNISPQVGVGFNRGYWSRLEGFVRHLAYQFDGLYVVTGPLWLPKKNKRTGDYEVAYPVIGTPPDAIAVPTHYFKVLLGRKSDGSFAIGGFILPNKPIPEKKDLRDFVASIEVIEKYSGLLFFDKLERVPKVELCEVSKCSLAGAFKKAIAETSG